MNEKVNEKKVCVNQVTPSELKRELSDLRSGISEDVAEVVNAITDRFFKIADNHEKRITSLEHYGKIIAIGFALALIIIALTTCV